MSAERFGTAQTAERGPAASASASVASIPLDVRVAREVPYAFARDHQVLVTRHDDDDATGPRSVWISEATSPHAIAEHSVALMLMLDRTIHRAYARVREGNFSLDGLLGFDLHGRRVGVVGTGRIGACVVRIMAGFGCEVLAFDPKPDAACIAAGARYVPIDELLGTCDIVTLHCPLTPQTRHLIDAPAIARMRRGAMLVNTSRGGVIDTQAVIGGLKSGAIGSLGLDVYEEEADLFFRDLSNTLIQDDVFARLLTFPNVVVTGHQAFFTEDALRAIAETTVGNLSAFETMGMPLHPVSVERLA